MKDCHVIEDLWPLYEEGLVQKNTKKWIDEHLQQCPHCQQLNSPLLETLDIPENTIRADKTIAQTTLKLHIYQLLFVVLSFLLAMNTSLLKNEGFHFILTYFLLGIILYYFYKSWLLTILIAFVPTFIWAIYDGIISYGSFNRWWTESLPAYPSVWHIVTGQLLMGTFVGIIHTLFAALGIVFVVLLKLSFKKEQRK